MALPADDIDAERNFDQILSLMCSGGAGPDEIFAATLARPQWQESAACRGSKAEFFPSRGEQDMTAAMALCLACTVRGGLSGLRPGRSEPGRSLGRNHRAGTSSHASSDCLRGYPPTAHPGVWKSADRSTHVATLPPLTIRC